MLELALIRGVEDGHADNAHGTNAAYRSARRLDDVVVCLHGADLEHETPFTCEVDEPNDLRL